MRRGDCQVQYRARQKKPSRILKEEFNTMRGSRREETDLNSTMKKQKKTKRKSGTGGILVVTVYVPNSILLRLFFFMIFLFLFLIKISPSPTPSYEKEAAPIRSLTHSLTHSPFPLKIPLYPVRLPTLRNWKNSINQSDGGVCLSKYNIRPGFFLIKSKSNHTTQHSTASHLPALPKHNIT